MKTLFFGAGSLACLYAHRLAQPGKQVTILARGRRFDQIQEKGLNSTMTSKLKEKTSSLASWMP